MTEAFSFEEPEFSFDKLGPEELFYALAAQKDATSPEFSFEALKTPEEIIKEETGYTNEWFSCPLCKSGYLQKTPRGSLYTRHQGGAIRPEEKIEEVIWLCTKCAFGETTKTEFIGVEE